MKIFSNWSGVSLIALAIITLVGCKSEGDHPGYTFMPDMATNRAYQSLSDNPNFEDGMSAREPVKGTIPRGLLPANVENSAAYLYTHHSENTTESYDSASSISNPFAVTDHSLSEGERMYKIYCAICHGPKGEGDGFIVESEKYPAVPPSYTATPKLVEMSDGQMFHSITYGFNMMGSHASQLTPEERWYVVQFINKLQGDYDEPEEEVEESDEAETAMVEEEVEETEEVEEPINEEETSTENTEG